MDEMIFKQTAIDALWKALYEYEDKTEKQFQESEDLDVADWFQHRIFVQNMNDIDRQTILNLPSTQQVPEEFEWCTDCKEYDQEAHCCHRWTKVIRNTVEEIKNTQPEPRWIPVSKRKPERRSYVLVTDCDGVEEAYYSSDGTWFDTLGDKLKDVTAWMPLPKPYERSEE